MRQSNAQHFARPFCSAASDFRLRWSFRNNFHRRLRKMPRKSTCKCARHLVMNMRITLRGQNASSADGQPESSFLACGFCGFWTSLRKLMTVSRGCWKPFRYGWPLTSDGQTQGRFDSYKQLLQTFSTDQKRWRWFSRLCQKFCDHVKYVPEAYQCEDLVFPC